MIDGQYLTVREMSEISQLLRCIGGLKLVFPEAFEIRDSDDTPLGRIASGENGVWGLYFVEVAEPVE